MTIHAFFCSLPVASHGLAVDILALAFLVLLVPCFVAVFIMLKRERQHRMDAELDSVRWRTVAEITNLLRFTYDPRTRKVFADGVDEKRISEFWPIVDGHAISSEGWILPEDLPLWREKKQAILSGATDNMLCTYHVRRGNQILTFRIFLKRDGRYPKMFVGIIQDVTKALEDQQRQEAATRLWQTCFETWPAMVFVKSADDFRYLQCNDSFARFIKKSKAEIIGKTDLELFDEELAREFIAEDRMVLEANRACDFSITRKVVDDQVRSLHTTKFPATDIDGAPILIGRSIDETEKVRQHNLVESFLASWESASELAQVVTYRIYYKTWEVVGPKRLADFWPNIDGKARCAEDVVIPEDVELCKKSYVEVIDGTVPSVIIQYRRALPDGIHYYRLYMRRDPHFEDAITGLVQDVTPFMESQREIEAMARLWETVTNELPALLFVKDADDGYKFLSANKKLGEFFGRPADYFIGRTAKDFMDDNDVKRIHDSDVRVMEAGEKFECYEHVRDAAGVDHHFHSVKLPAVAANGHRIMIQMTIDQNGIQELAEVRKIISRAFEALFLSDDVEAGTQQLLKDVCEFVGYSRAWVCCVDPERDVVRLFVTYVPDDEPYMFNDHEFKIKDAQKQKWYQNIMSSKKGEIFDCDFSNEKDLARAQEVLPRVVAIKDQFDVRGVYVHFLEVGGKPWGYVGFCTQYEPVKKLTENEKALLNVAATIIELAVTRKRTVINLQKAKDDAMKAARAKADFLSTMSHEIRTPLNAVLGFAELLQDEDLDMATRKDYLASITSSGTALLDLINDILSLSKLSAGKMAFTLKETNILDLATQVGMVFSPKCRAKKVRFVGALPPGLPSVMVDPVRLKQILFNLIGNAVKFTEVGSVTLFADFIKETETTGTLILHVKDTGIGISESDLKQIGEPFAQANMISGTSLEHKGTGLGLAICKQMLFCMDGELKIESTLGKGSVFTAELHNVKYSTGPSEVPVLTAPEQMMPEELTRLSVLLVDDSQVSLEVMKAVMTRLGIDPVIATHADAALGEIARRPFDFVFTDLWMPGMNGADLAKRIHYLLKDKSPKIVVLTADTDANDRFDLSCFDAVMSKPVTPHTIKNYICSTLEATTGRK